MIQKAGMVWMRQDGGEETEGEGAETEGEETEETEETEEEDNMLKVLVKKGN